MFYVLIIIVLNHHQTVSIIKSSARERERNDSIIIIICVGIEMMTHLKRSIVWSGFAGLIVSIENGRRKLKQQYKTKIFKNRSKVNLRIRITSAL